MRTQFRDSSLQPVCMAQQALFVRARFILGNFIKLIGLASHKKRRD